MNNNWQLKPMATEEHKDHPDTTYCNKCGHLLRFYEYAILDECPRCGYSLARNYYWVCLGLAVVATLFCGVQYLVERTPVVVGSAILLCGLAWAWALGAVGIDLLLRRFTPMDKAIRRSIGGWISFLPALGFLCWAYYPVSNFFGMPMPSLRETIAVSPLLHDLPEWLVLTLNIAGCAILWYGLFLVIMNGWAGDGALLKRTRHTVRVTFNSRKCLTIMGAAAALLVGAFKPWFGDLTAELPRLFLLGVGAFLLIQALLPASILFLSASQDKGRSVLITIQRAGYPLRFAHLLNIAGGGMPGLGTSQIRVFSNWRSAVNAFSDVVPIIIVDLRVNTAHVQAEVRNIFDRHLLVKTVFVIEERFSDFSLLALYPYAKKGDQAVVASPDMLESAMRDLSFEVLRGPVSSPFKTLAKSLRIITIG